MTGSEAIRVLSWYEKDAGGELVGQEEIVNISLIYLQLIFNVSKENPMYDSFEVKKEQSLILQNYMQTKIKINDYDYFVEIM